MSDIVELIAIPRSDCCDSEVSNYRGEYSRFGTCNKCGKLTTIHEKKEPTDIVEQEIKEFRVQLDEIIEDMESYNERPDTLIYADELFERINKWGKTFLTSFALKLRRETIDTIYEKVGNMHTEVTGKDNHEYIDTCEIYKLLQTMKGK